MTHPFKRRRQRIAVFTTMLACTTRRLLRHHRGIHDGCKNADLMKNKKTVCVTRYLCVAPIETQVRFSKGFTVGSVIDPDEESTDEFWDRIIARELEIPTYGTAPVPNGSGRIVKAQNFLIHRMVRRIEIDGRDRGYQVKRCRRVDMVSASFMLWAGSTNKADSLANLHGIAFASRKGKVGELWNSVLVAPVQQFISQTVQNWP